MVLRPGVRVLILIGLLTALLPAQQNRLAGPIDPARSLVARGSVPRLARPADDRGAVDPGFPLGNITLLLRPSPAQQAALEQLLAEQQDPASPRYHDWLTPEAYADRFGASPADLEKISGWLESQGFTVKYTARGRDFISFSGTAAQVESALHTQIHRFEAGGKTHFANATDFSLPADLAPLVAGVKGLHDFHPHAPHKKLMPGYDLGDGINALLPDDMATIYDVVPLYSNGYLGAGVTIVIVGQSDIDPEDIASFRSMWGLPPTTIPVITAGTYPGFDDDDEMEADLDLEWSGAVARYANLVFVISDDADYASFYSIDNNLGPVISESFGDCESADVANNSFGLGISSYETQAQKGNSLGITWMASSGDSGAAGCDYQANIAVGGLAVGLPSSVPEVTAVGGTEFNEGTGTYWSTTNGPYGGSALSYIPEMAWNDTSVSEALGAGLAASGGGASILYKKPSWQTGTGVPNDGARDVPDVSLNASNAHDFYLVVSQGDIGGVGGTSASSPSFAGMVALLNQFLVQNNVQSKPGVGNLNQKLYPLAAAPSNGAFHDITVGNNIVPCEAQSPNCVSGQLGYKAGPGYDLVTGLGSVDAYKLVTAYAALPVISTTTSITASPSTITSSGSSTLTITVKAASGTTSPSGSVSIILGNSTLASVPLSGTGGTATATFTVFGGQLLTASNTIEAYYPGDPTFGVSHATTTLTLGTPTATSKVTVTVNPNPVYQHAPDSKGGIFSFTIQLAETAGVSTTLTGFTFGGVSYTSSIAQFFGSTTLAARGTLSASLEGNNIAAPSSQVVAFTGRDMSGATWSQQVTVSFMPPQ